MNYRRPQLYHERDLLSKDSDNAGLGAPRSAICLQRDVKMPKQCRKEQSQLRQCKSADSYQHHEICDY